MPVPIIENPKGRRLVREALQLIAGYGYSQGRLLEQVNELAAPAQANHSQLRDWIEWNHSRNYVRTEFNEDEDKDLWYITKEGIAKQSVR